MKERKKRIPNCATCHWSVAVKNARSTVACIVHLEHKDAAAGGNCEHAIPVKRKREVPR
jgi:hypothetical protein